MGLLQSPWIPKKWPKHLLIFSSAQNNQIVGGMMKKKEGKKIDKEKFKLDLKFCDFREECDDDEKFYPRLTFLYF